MLDFAFCPPCYGGVPIGDGALPYFLALCLIKLLALFVCIGWVEREGGSSTLFGFAYGRAVRA